MCIGWSTHLAVGGLLLDAKLRLLQEKLQEISHTVLSSLGFIMVLYLYKDLSEFEETQG